MGCLSRGTICRVENQAKWKKCKAVSKAERAEPSRHFVIRYRTIGFGICSGGVWSSSDPVFSYCTLFFPFRMMLYILCHCRLEVYNLLFSFMGIAIKRLPLVSVEILKHWGFWDYWDFWSWTKSILHCDVVTSLCWLESGMCWFKWE